MATTVADEAERALIARCRQGDQEAIRLPLERHHQTVYRVAYALTGNPTDAAEIVHDTEPGEPLVVIGHMSNS